MTLGRRVSVIVVITLAMLLTTLSWFVDRVIVEEFRQHEVKTVNQHVQRVVHAFDNLKEQLETKVVDWAQWDNTYEFIENSDQKYIHETVNFLTLTAVQFQQVIYFNSKVEPLHHYEVFLREERVSDIPASTLEILKKAPLAINAKDSPTTGLMQLDGSLVLFASSPILDSKREKESRGSLLGTMLVNPTMFGTLAEQTNLSLTADRIGIDQLGKTENLALEQLLKGENVYINEVNEDLLHGYGLIRDTFGKPALLFRIDNNRTSYQQALNVRQFMRASLLVAGVLWAILALWLINYWILRPVTKLSSDVRKIANAGNSELRVGNLEQGKSLKLRAFLIIGSTMLVLTGALSYLFTGVLSEEFSRIESSDLIDDVHRAQRGLDERRETLLSKAIDWGQWDDTYQFILDQNTEYLDANITFETLGAIGMSHVVFFDTTGALVTGRALDSGTESILEIKTTDRNITSPIESFIKGKSEPTSGYIQIDSQPYMVAMSPILDTTRTMASRGFFVFVMPIDNSLAEALASQTELNLHFVKNNSDLQNIPSVSGSNEITFSAEGTDTVIGKLPLLDANGAKISSLEVRADRDVYQQGLRAQKALTLWLLGSSAVFLIVTLIALQVWVIRRVSDLKSKLLKGYKIDPSGKQDELSILSEDINGMLNSLNEAQAEIVKARDAAEAANNAKSSFIAKVSHELRTPIHGIIGMLRIVLKQETNPSRRSHLGMARDAAYALLSTINDILDFSKAEAGMLSVHPVPFDLKHSVRGALRTVAPRVYERDGLEILCEYDSSIPSELVGDPVRLKQVLVNLLGNSAKFTNAGFVKLLVRKDGLDSGKCLLHIEISDTGIGIPEDRLPTIFDPFTQADNSAARKYQGTGLGLTIVKQLVEAMGGSITVTSKIGVGSCFTITLPLEVSKAEAHSSFSSINPVLGKDVIIIDHCTERRESFQQYLLGVGATSVRFDPVGSTSRNTVIIATGECLLMPEYREFLREFGKNFGYDSIVTLHTPNQLSLREELHAQGVRLMLTRPVISSDIIEALRGDIEVEMKSDESDDSVPAQVTKRRRVLIADDTPTNLIILRDLLEERGFEVTSVTNGQEILTKMSEYLSSGKEAPFDIILSDVQMPQMDGVTATKLIREKEQNGRHIPVVMVTAHAFPEEKQRLLDAGADGVVTKPIEPDELGKILNRTLSAS